MIDRVKERIDDVKVEVLRVLQSVINASIEVEENGIESDLQANYSIKRQLSIGDELKAKQQNVIKALLKPM